MPDAIRDQNFITSKLGVLFSDGETLVPIAINSSNDGIKTNTTDVVDPSILALYEAGKAIPRDANDVPALCAQSNTDANVVYPIFVDSDGAILIDM